MANYHHQFLQYDETLFPIINQNQNRHAGPSGFVTNRAFYQGDPALLSRGGMRDFFVSNHLPEQIPLNAGTGRRFLSDSGVQVIRHSPARMQLSIPQLQRLDDSIILEGRQSWGRELQRLDESIILEGESVGVVLSKTEAEAAVRVLMAEKVKATTDCSICLESVGVGEVVARMPCSHVFHRSCISRWLHKKPSCPLCRAPAS